MARTRTATTRTTGAQEADGVRARRGRLPSEPERERERGPAPQREPEPQADTPDLCPVAFCPICAAVSAVNRASPEVIEHLLGAARELFLAAKVAMDARAGDLADRGEPSAGLEHIQIG